MRKSARERLQDARRGKPKQEQMTLEDLMRLMLAGHKEESERRINPTQQRFIFSPARNKAYMGAAGVSKTSTIVAAGLLRALLQPGSKGFIGRADYNDLMDTTMLRAEEMLAALPGNVLLDRDKSPPMKWWIQPVIPDGEISQITFMGMKDAIGSYEFNWAIIDEADEVDEKRILELSSRLRARGGNYSLMMAFNPPDKNHHLYTMCTGRDGKDKFVRDPMFELFVAVKGENDENLPPGYHAQLMKDLPEDMRVRLVEGQWGAVFPGQPVYREFNYQLHTANDVPFDPHGTLYRFWDFGYNHPYCVYVQEDYYGRLNWLFEVKGEKQELHPFIDTVQQRFSRSRLNTFKGDFEDFGDPAARQKKDTGSTLVELSKRGIRLQYRIATIEYGLREFRLWLEKVINGRPAFQFDRDGVPYLINGLRGGYRMDDSGQKPKKDGYYDHGMDAARYGVTNVLGNGREASESMKDFPDSIEYGGE